MADIALLDPSQGALVLVGTDHKQYHDKPVAEDLATPGVAVRLDDASGEWTPANASVAAESTVKGIALKIGRANRGMTVVYEGPVHGFDLSALAFGAPVFLSDTDGALADIAPATTGAVTVEVGFVDSSFVRAPGEPAQKVLFVKIGA